MLHPKKAKKPPPRGPSKEEKPMHRPTHPPPEDKTWISVRRWLAFSLLLCAGAVLPTQAAESNSCPAPVRDYWTPDARVGDFQFDIPGNWKLINDQGTTALMPVAQQGRALTRIGFFPPQTLNGNVRQYFESLWAAMRRQVNAIDNGTPETSHSDRGYDLIKRYSRIYASSIGNGTFWLALAIMGNRAEAYFFVDNTGNLEYQEAFRSFEHSVQFANAEQSELSEPGVPCGMNGIFVGWKALALTPALRIQTLVFFPDGNVIREVPQGGLKDFDFGRQIKESRPSCGRYRMVGNEIRIRWSDDTRMTATREGTKLEIEGFKYIPVANSDGAKLDGTYRTEWAPAGPRIRLTSDGRFVENGILDFIDYRGPDKSPGAGTYTIEMNTIELHYSTGRDIPLSFYVFADDSGPRPKLIHLNSKGFVTAPQ